MWREISEALVTTAGKIHPSKRHDWQAVIGKFLDDLLTSEDEGEVQELFDWYKQDAKVNKSVEDLQEITVHILEEPRSVAEGKTPAIQAINENMEALRSAVGAI